MKILIPVIMLTLWVADGNATEWFKKYLMSVDTTMPIISCGATEANPSDPQGGYLVVGFPPSHASYILRIDVFGRTLWSKYYPGLDGAKCAHFTGDNGFLIGGNFGVTKIDKNGNPAWGSDASGTPLVRNKQPAIYIEKIGENSYVCVDQTIGKISFISEKDSAATSDTLQYKPGLYSALGMNDGGAVFSGQLPSGGYGLYKIAGDRKLDSSFGKNGSVAIAGTYPYSIDFSSDGGYVVSYQNMDSNIVLAKIDKTGTIISDTWNGMFDNLTASTFKPFMDVSWGVRKLSSGDFLLAGICKNDSGDVSDYFILKADASGNEVWRRVFDHPGIDGYY